MKSHRRVNSNVRRLYVNCGVTMSTDFIALFDVSSREIDLEWLFRQLLANPQFVASMVERYRDKWLVKNWEIEKSEVTGSALLGPGGFVFRLNPRTLEMYHMMRFSTFTGDESSRAELRNVCMAIAKLVGSDRAIYTHELMPYDGEGLIQIEKRLRDEIGPPAGSFQQLHTAEYYAACAWYIDRFEDRKEALKLETAAEQALGADSP